MYRVIYEPEHGQRVPLRLWARSVAPETQRQLQRLASQPFVVEFVGGMVARFLVLLLTPGRPRAPPDPRVPLRQAEHEAGVLQVAFKTLMTEAP